MNEELEKEAEEKYGEVDREFIACQDEGEVFNIGYVLGAEPREKQIAELSKHIVELQNDKGELIDRCRELEAQIEKLIDFVLSKTECCDVCPITDTCINSEGTCPYTGILAKSEEEVTREWLLQYISRR